MRGDKEAHQELVGVTVLHTVFLVVAGLVLTGILSAEFEMLGMRNPYLSKILAGVCVIITAYQHRWKGLLIALGVLFVFLGLRREFQLRAERKNRAKAVI
jgi:hypothetical protein